MACQRLICLFLRFGEHRAMLLTSGKPVSSSPFCPLISSPLSCAPPQRRVSAHYDSAPVCVTLQIGVKSNKNSNIYVSAFTTPYSIRLSSQATCSTIEFVVNKLRRGISRHPRTLKSACAANIRSSHSLHTQRKKKRTGSWLKAVEAVFFLFFLVDLPWRPLPLTSLSGLGNACRLP